MHHNLGASHAENPLMTVSQSHRSFYPNLNQNEQRAGNPSVEMCQRIVIRNLSKTLSRVLSHNEDLQLRHLDSYTPNNEGDRAVWYLELLESQLGKYS